MAGTIMTWLGRLVVTGALLALLWALGRMPAGSPREDAVLRLAWRMSGAQVRVCRERSEEELQRMLHHMRQRQACSEYAIPYRLTLRIGGETRLEREVSPRGAKGDRPIYVQEDLAIAPGRYRVQLDFAPIMPSAGDGENGEEEDQSSEKADELRKAIEAKTRHSLDHTLQVAAGRITLIELGEGEGGWQVYEPH